MTLLCLSRLEPSSTFLPPRLNPHSPKRKGFPSLQNLSVLILLLISAASGFSQTQSHLGADTHFIDYSWSLPWAAPPLQGVFENVWGWLWVDLMTGDICWPLVERGQGPQLPAACRTVPPNSWLPCLKLPFYIFAHFGKEVTPFFFQASKPGIILGSSFSYIQPISQSCEFNLQMVSCIWPSNLVRATIISTWIPAIGS